MRYYMPTMLIEEDDVVSKQSHLFKTMGEKALIVTGKNSARINGALSDVTTALSKEGIPYEHFDGVVENPPVENIVSGASAGAGCDFIIGIGGGSPIDAAKAIGILMANGSEEAYTKLFEITNLKSVPIIAIPTTAGTGTEVTPYAIITDHKNETKRNFSSKIFPEYALMDVKYFMFMSKSVRDNTCVDALSHMIESYMSVRATPYSDYIALEGMRIWGQVKSELTKDEMDIESMRQFVRASTFGGIAIAQAGTSLPHGMGYALTYHHDVAHGKANGLLTYAFLSKCSDTDKVAMIYKTLGFDSLEEMGEFLKKVLGEIQISEEQIELYAKQMMGNEAKLKNHPDAVDEADLIQIYNISVGG